MHFLLKINQYILFVYEILKPSFKNEFKCIIGKTLFDYKIYMKSGSIYILKINYFGLKVFKIKVEIGLFFNKKKTV